jgi:Sec-independent protein translocase protein TatA
MAGIGFWGFVIIGVIMLLVFGTARFGRAFRGLKTGGRELKRGLQAEDDEHPPPPA